MLANAEARPAEKLKTLRHGTNRSLIEAHGFTGATVT